jgi:hypothetical protein
MQTNSFFQSNRSHQALLSRHAQKRSQQRGINAEAIELIRTFGVRTHDGMGGVRYSMVGSAIERVRKLLGHSQKLDALQGTYVVFSADDAGIVITVGHRHQ